MSPKIEWSVNWSDDRILWIEFDEWLPPDNDPLHPTDAAEVHADDLDPA